MSKDNVVKVNQLPEKKYINRSDYLIAEDGIDTWKIKAGYLNDYIDDNIEAIQNKVDSKIEELQNTGSDVSRLEQEVSNTLKQITEQDTIIKQNEIKREESYKTTQNIIKEYESLDVPGNMQNFESYIEQVKIDEQTRQQNELNRGIKETERIKQSERVETLIDEVSKTNTQIQQNESSRVTEFNQMKIDMEKRLESISLDNYPVGSIYYTSENINPSTIFNGTNWVSEQFLFEFEEYEDDSDTCIGTTNVDVYKWIRVS